MRKRALVLYNTESLQKEEIVPLDGKTIRMYTCGPTVYNFAHIGNFRTYVFEDLLRRTIKFFGFPIQQAMNLTDIDDKTIKGALQNKISLDEFTRPFKDAFFADLATLGIERVEFYPQATDYIPEMIEMIETLVKKGVAYAGQDGSIYFAINQFPSYGRLAHLEKDALKAGASNRVALDEYEKENVSDFVLWKAYDKERDGGIYWESPFGRGRPGWHIECSAMATKLLGKSIDIHVGAVDNLFPHHENEIAQSEACFCCRFVKHWLHAEHLLVDHKKMSKSLGNFYTLRDLMQKGYTGKQVRYALLQAHYRTQLNFTFESLDAAVSTLRRLEDFVLRMKEISDEKTKGLISPLLQKTMEAFESSLADDLNISLALSSVFDLVREINTLCDQKQIGIAEAKEVLDFLKKIDEVLHVIPLTHEEEVIPEGLKQALKKREEARLAKDWKAADACRDLILSSGYLIDDTPQGARLRKKNERGL